MIVMTIIDATHQNKHHTWDLEDSQILYLEIESNNQFAMGDFATVCHLQTKLCWLIGVMKLTPRQQNL